MLCKLLKIAAACSLAIGSIGTASAVNYHFSAASNAFSIYLPGASDPQLVAQGQGWADYVSPGIYNISTATGTFTSLLGNGNITGVFTGQGTVYNNLAFPNSSTLGGNPFATTSNNQIAFTTDNANVPYLVLVNNHTNYWNAVGGFFSGYNTPPLDLFAANVAVGAPEIDGGKLPLAVLLLGLVAVIARRQHKAMLAL